jgi:Transglycosylase SLT domain
VAAVLGATTTAALPHRQVTQPAALTGFVIAAGQGMRQPPPSVADPVIGSPGPSLAGAPPRQLVVPDLIAALPTGITQAQVAKIGKLSGVRTVLPVDGGQVTLNGKAANVIGVSPQAFRAWTPPETAAAAAAWSGLSSGALLVSKASASKLGLQQGTRYTISGAAELTAPFGAAVSLGVPGIDAVVDAQRSTQLGLIKNVAVLINAPAANLNTLMQQVRSVIGAKGKVVNLVPVVAPGSLPVAQVNVPAGQVPTNYLTLFQDSAAKYCAGLSWTVLAAIGEIESGDGANVGPSTAGALGPMQFLPSTWAVWGIDGFGPAGAPDIMNPLDAVPSAARMLCADGATNGTAGLYQAIYDYNHATWYVNEVLALAAEYAQAYR